MANVVVWLSLMLVTDCLPADVVIAYVYYDVTERVNISTENADISDIVSPQTTPLAESDLDKEKKYALAVFFKTNWFRAAQYCRYRGMQLASVSNDRQEKLLEAQIESVGFELGPTWTSGTDLSEEGVFFWSSTGTPVTYTKWGKDQPGGDKEENCLYVNNDPHEGFSWQDEDCSADHYFACEYFPSNFSLNNDSPKYV